LLLLAGFDNTPKKEDSTVRGKFEEYCTWKIMHLIRYCDLINVLGDFLKYIKIIVVSHALPLFPVFFPRSSGNKKNVIFSRLII
jgi:hypothetical protein